MRTKEIRKWIEEGGSLPEDLTLEEKEHLTNLGWQVDEGWWNDRQKCYEETLLHGKLHGKAERWWEDGQKSYEWNWFHGMKHGVFKEWYEDGDLRRDEEYFYGNKIKETS